MRSTVASVSITTRQTKDGPRYAVRFRLGGRAYPAVHGGSFATMKEAKVRRDLIAGELAAGRNPADLLRAITTQVVRRTFEQWGRAVSDEPHRPRRRDREERRLTHQRDPGDIQGPRPRHDHPGRRARVDRIARVEAGFGASLSRNASRCPGLRRRRPEPGPRRSRPATPGGIHGRRPAHCAGRRDDHRERSATATTAGGEDGGGATVGRRPGMADAGCRGDVSARGPHP